MKTLYLVRHAKSSWEDESLPDEQRPLVQKGIKKAGQIVEFLIKRHAVIDLMISSPAVRAFETARILAEGLHYPADKIKIDRKIYDGSYDRMLDVIYATEDEVNSLMIVGHNPTITGLTNLFLHPGIELIPTSGVVCISFLSDQWAGIASTEPIREFIIFPKML